MTKELKRRIDWIVRDILLYGGVYNSKLTSEEITKIEEFHVNELVKLYENNPI